MTGRQLVSRLISLLLLTQLMACSDHQLPGLKPARLRIKTMTLKKMSAGNPADTLRWGFRFQYDARNRLQSIRIDNAPDQRNEYSTYQYDSQNRLVRFERYRSEPAVVPVETYTFSYNPAGQTQKILYARLLNGKDSLLIECYPEYDAQQQLTRSQVRQIQSGQVTHTGNAVYKFTGANLTSSSMTVTQHVSPVHTDTLAWNTFSYDDKPNPFYHILMPTAELATSPYLFNYYPYYGGIVNLLALSRNNILSDGSAVFTYTYNNTGLPTTRTQRSKDTTTPIEIYQFDYESF